jgi:hypothetical protein
MSSSSSARTARGSSSARRFVEREAVRDAGAAVVTADEEPLEAERAHRLEHVARHRALAVG